MAGHFSFERRKMRRWEQIQIRFIDPAIRLCSIFLYEAFNRSVKHDVKPLTKSGMGIKDGRKLEKKKEV